MENLTKLKELTDVLGKVYDFNHKLIDAINLSHEGIAILDVDGNYTWMNEAHETMFGYGKDELIGKSWKTIYKPEDVEWFVDNVFPIIRKEGKWSGEAIAIQKDGTTPVHEMVYLTALPDGGLICTCRDRGYEVNKWEMLFNKLPFGVCIAGVDGYFKHINEAFTSILGYTEQELLTTPFTDFIHPEDLPSTYEKIGELSTLKPVIGFVNRYKTESGEWVRLEWTATSNSDGQIFALAKKIQ